MTPTASDAVVVGVGMMTSVGVSAAETGASVRAGVTRFTDSPWLDDLLEPFPLAEVIEGALPALAPALAAVEPSTREARLLRLGTAPLLECRRALMVQSGIGLALALPDTRYAPGADGRQFVQRLAQQTNGAFDEQIATAKFSGRAGGLMAIAEAVRRVQEGDIAFMIAGGIDTYRDFWVLNDLDAQHRIRSSSSVDAFVPGEGAGFIALTSRATAQGSGIAPLATVSMVTEGFEPGHLYSGEVYRGEGLSRALTRFFQETGDRPLIQEVFCSMNGENYWAKEWGVAYLRNQQRFHPDHRIHHPADCFGDTGAACGPLLVGLAVCGMARRYRSQPCLVYCSSDNGPRAVLAVATA